MNESSTCVFLVTNFFSVLSCMSTICLVSVSNSAGRIFLFPRKTLVFVSPVEKMFKFWQGGIFTVAPFFFPFSFFPLINLLSPLVPRLLSLWRTAVKKICAAKSFFFASKFLGTLNLKASVDLFRPDSAWN